jgi:hypothetical protein
MTFESMRGPGGEQTNSAGAGEIGRRHDQPLAGCYVLDPRLRVANRTILDTP